MILVAVLFLSGATAIKPVAMADAVSGFHTWHKVNSKPEQIPYWVDALCRNSTPLEASRAAANPHRNRYVTVWVNSVGKYAMLHEGSFPVGSTIVKEKHDGVAGPAILSTVMVKRAKGYNPKCGDWEFGVLDATGKRVAADGRLESCMKCHEERASLDFTYRTYVHKNLFTKG